MEFKDKIKTIGFVGTRMANDKQFQRDRERHTAFELKEYEDCVREGQQPDGTLTHNTQMSKRMSDELGVAYRGDDLTGTAVRAGKMEQPVPLSKDEKREIREKAIREGRTS